MTLQLPQFNQPNQQAYSPGPSLLDRFGNGLAAVIAAQQQQRENEQAQQRIGVEKDRVASENRRLDIEEAKTKAERERQRRIGETLRAAAGLDPMYTPPAQRGNQLQAGAGAGLLPGATPQLGNQTQAGAGLAGQLGLMPGEWNHGQIQTDPGFSPPRIPSPIGDPGFTRPPPVGWDGAPSPAGIPGQPFIPGQFAQQAPQGPQGALQAPQTPQGPPEVSVVPASRQKEFEAWLRRNKIKDLDGPDTHYDYRGAFLAGIGRSANGHWPDTFKQHGHPTFSEESQYSQGPGDGGTWTGPNHDQFQPGNPSPQTPQGPGGDVLGTGQQQPGRFGSIPPDLAQLLQNVAPEDVPAVLDQYEAMKQLMPKPPELPTQAQEYQWYQTLTPQQQAEFKRLYLDKQPTTQLSVTNTGESQYAKDTATEDVKRLAQYRTEAKNAYAALPRISEAYKLSSTIYSGVGSNVELSLGRVISKLGGKAAGDKVADTQTFLRLAGQGMVQYLNDRTFGAGTGVSDQDREWALRLAGGDIALDAKGLRRILRINAQIGLEKVQTAIVELQEQAENYPQGATRNKREAEDLTKKMVQMQNDYDSMMRRESALDQQDAAELRNKASKTPGLRLRPGAK